MSTGSAVRAGAVGASNVAMPRSRLCVYQARVGAYATSSEIPAHHARISILRSTFIESSPCFSTSRVADVDRVVFDVVDLQVGDVVKRRARRDRVEHRGHAGRDGPRSAWACRLEP